MSRAVCRFWQQGNCRNGNNCRFEHIGASGQPNNNRFSALSGNTSSRNGEMPYLLSKEVLEKDLTEPERPKWILSAYGPGKDAPDQLFGGYPIEQSFEEIRMHYMKGQASGNPQGALTEIEGLYNQAQQKIQNALSNLDGALQYVIDSANKHPNRIDICQQNSRPGGTTGEFAVGRQISTGTTAFGTPAISQPSTGAFGQPSGLGQRPSPFGAPASSSPFGQPSQLGGASAFGQPSQLGGTSAFGQPSQLGGGSTSSFGQPSQLGSTSGFGQASALGAKPSPFGAAASPFGQPAQPASGGFGQASALGQKPSPFGGGTTSGPSPFGGAASGGNANPFGQPSQAPAPSPFGQTPQTQVASPFGQAAAKPSPFGAAPGSTGQQNNSPFGQPTTTNAFGQPAQQSQQPSAFGVPSTGNTGNAFGGGGANASPFGGQANSNATPNAFQQAAQQATPFGGAATATQQGQPQGQSPYAAGAARQHPPVETYSAKGPDGLLRMFKGRPVEYRVLKGEEKAVPVTPGPNGTVVRVWHPDGAPPYNPDTEAANPNAYDSNVLQQWKSFVDTGKFVDGLIPEVPPKREFCAWDF